VSVEEHRSGLTFASTFDSEVAARDERPVSILALGDSLTEGWGATDLADPWTRRLQVLLRARWPTITNGVGGGAGYLPSWHASQSLPDPEVTGSPAEVWDHGIGFRSLRLEAGDAVTFEVVGTTARLWYATRPTGGAAMAVAVDGGEPQLISQEVGVVAAEATVDLPLGASGPHEVEVAHAAGVDAAIGGLQVFDGDEDSGLTVLNGGRSGMFAAQLAHPSVVPRLADQVRLLDPSLVLLMLGVNDMTLHIAPSTFHDRIATAVASVRTGDPEVPIVLIGSWQHAGDFTHPWSAYLEQLEAIAASTPGVMFLDMTDHWPRAGTVEAAAAGHYRDVVHLSSQGNEALAALVAEALLEEDGAWRRIGTRGEAP